MQVGDRFVKDGKLIEVTVVISETNYGYKEVEPEPVFEPVFEPETEEVKEPEATFEEEVKKEVKKRGRKKA